MELHEIVFKLVGPVRAVGETHTDLKRFENIKALTALTEKLLGAISEAALDADRQEASMQAIGLHARYFLREVRDEMQEVK